MKRLRIFLNDGREFEEKNVIEYNYLKDKGYVCIKQSIKDKKFDRPIEYLSEYNDVARVQEILHNRKVVG